MNDPQLVDLAAEIICRTRCIYASWESPGSQRQYSLAKINHNQAHYRGEVNLKLSYIERETREHTAKS